MFATQDASIAGTSGFWSAARSANGQVAVMGGWVSVHLESDLPPARWRMVARWDNESAYRDVTIVEGPVPQLWAATSDGHLEVLELGTPNPKVIHRAPLGAPGEPYGVEVDPSSARVVIVTSRGWFLIVDRSRLPATSFTWPAF